jgi:hypothetical protein
VAYIHHRFPIGLEGADMFIERVTVEQNERAIVIRNGEFVRVLEPGRYRLFVWPFASLEIEIHRLTSPRFRSRWSEDLLQKRSNITEAHFTRIETDECEMAMIFVDGELFEVLLPDKRVLYWKCGAKVTVEKLIVIDAPELPTAALTAWEQI